MTADPIIGTNVVCAGDTAGYSCTGTDDDTKQTRSRSRTELPIYDEECPPNIIGWYWPDWPDWPDWTTNSVGDGVHVIKWEASAGSISDGSFTAPTEGGQYVTITATLDDEAPAVDEGSRDDGPVQKTKEVAIVAVESVTADKPVVCVGSNVTCTATTDPAGYEDLIEWNGGGDPATGSGKTFITKWTDPGEHTITASCGTSSKSTNVVAIEVDFTVESDEPRGLGNGLTDNRQATTTITVNGLDDPSALSFSFEATPSETGTIINKKGTAISFTPTADHLVWRTSKTYWYGVLPEECCYFYSHKYKFTLTVDGICEVLKEYGTIWPNEDPKMIPSVSDKSTTVVHDPEPVPGIPNWYRCLIEFGDFTKTATTVGIPTTDQYSEENSKEENYHVLQWKGAVSDGEGGQGDCFTAKGIRWMIGWIGEGPWYTYGDTPEEAKADAVDKVETGETREKDKSWEISELDRGFIELKAKEYAGYNAAWKYHCTYESEYGPNPANNHHPAY